VGRSGWWLFVLVSLIAVVTPAGAAPSRSCEQVPSRVLVHVHGVRSDKGTLVADLYGDQPEQFLKKGARLRRHRVPARPGSVALCLEAPGPGSYAVAVYHDENGNRKFDRAWTGLPAEGYGLSNNPPPVLRVPSYDDSAIQVGTEPRVVNINLRY
jgi:uncharacterized protein (DUF2141 family)